MANRILTKNSTSADNVPSTSECTVSEIGANTTDGKLYLGTDLAGAGHSSAGDDSTEVSWVGAVIKDEDNMASNSDDALATQQSIKAYADETQTCVISHNYYGSSTGIVYIPFGGSSYESSSTSSTLTDDTVFIAPHDGKIKRIMLYNDYSSTATPGSTDCKLHINGSLGSAMNTIGAPTWSYKTSLAYDCGQNHTFSKGDVLRVGVDPTSIPRYVAITTVWEFNTTT